jgi:hypothetical protein
MDNTSQPTVFSGSLSVWIRTSAASKLTDSMLLGSKKAILTWASEKKTVSLNEVDDKNAVINNLFTVSVASIEKAYFLSMGEIVIAADKKRYDMRLRDSSTDSALAADAVQLAAGGVHVKNDGLVALQAFLKQENPKVLAISRITSRTFITAIIILFVIILIGVIVSYVKGRLSA